MKKFIEILFRDSSSIPLDLKHEFGQVARVIIFYLFIFHIFNLIHNS